MLPACSPGPGPSIQLKWMRRACLSDVARAPGTSGKERSKEGESKFPPPTRAPDIVQAPPGYQQGAWALRFSECTEPGGTHGGCGCSRLLGPLGKGRSSDKEAGSESPCTARDSDLRHVAPWYQKEVSAPGYSECTKRSGAHVGRRCSSLPGAFEKGRTTDKEARSEFPLNTCDSDLKHVSPWY